MNMKICLILPLILLDPSFGQTSLEHAFTEAFNAKVEDGSYARLFGDIADIKSTLFCTGNAKSWETPPLEVGEGGESDLAVVLDATALRVAKAFSLNWWEELGKELGRMYNTSVDIHWNATLETSQEGLAPVYDGRFDAACARWSLVGFVMKMARSCCFLDSSLYYVRSTRTHLHVGQQKQCDIFRAAH